MVKKLVLFALFLLVSAGTNLHLLSQETLPDTVWTKNLYPDKIVASRFINNDTQVLVVAMSNIFIFDTQTGLLVIKKSIKEFLDNQDVNCIDICQEKNSLVVGTKLGKVAFFDLKTLDTLKTINFANNIGEIAFSFDYNFVYINESNMGEEAIDNLYYYNLSDYSLIKKLGDDGITRSISVERLGKYFATDSYVWGFSNWSKRIQLWDAKNNKFITTLGTQEDHTTDLEFSPDGKYLASSSMDGTIKIWDVEQRKLWKEYDNNPKGSDINEIAFSPDSKYMIFAAGKANHYETKLLDLNNLIIIKTYNYSGWNDISVSNDQKKIVLCTTSNLTLLNAKWTGTDVPNKPVVETIIYPNPNDGNANIEILLENSQFINIEILDISGNTIQALFSGILNQGINNLIWETKNIPSGTYFCKITGSSFDRTIKIIVNK